MIQKDSALYKNIDSSMIPDWNISQGDYTSAEPDYNRVHTEISRERKIKTAALSVLGISAMLMLLMYVMRMAAQVQL